MRGMRFLQNYGVLLLIMIGSLIYRLLLWHHTPVYLYGDMYRYDAIARHLLVNGYMGIGAIPDAYCTPGYPLFLAMIYKISMWFHGGQLLSIARVAHETYFVQQILSISSILLAYLFAKELFNRYAGLAAALIYALYLPNTYVGELLLTENLFVPLSLLALYLAQLALRKKNVILYLIAGIVLGIATLVRPFVLPLMVLFLIGILWQARTGRLDSPTPYRVGAKQAGALLGGTVLVLLPWWIRNLIDFHHFIPLSTEAGNPLLAGVSPYFHTPFPQLAAAAKALNESQQTYAIHMIEQGFLHHFWLYLGWFLIGKLYFLFWSPWLYNYIAWVDGFHRLIVFAGGIAVIAGVFVRQMRLLAVSILFLLAMQLVFLPLDRYGYPLVILMGVLLPAVVAYGIAFRRGGNTHV